MRTSLIDSSLWRKRSASIHDKYRKMFIPDDSTVGVAKTATADATTASKANEKRIIEMVEVQV